MNLDKLRLERWQFYPKAKPLKKKDMMRFFFVIIRKLFIRMMLSMNILKMTKQGKIQVQVACIAE